MSCSSIKRRFDELKSGGGVNFDAAMELYNDLKGSLDAHKLELSDLKQNGDKDSINHLQQHIKDGEEMLSSLHSMTLQ